ncbi:hypothetical protein [Mycolicibacterium komossense]|uniref:PE-PGRS family protein n=1 Tax=Mycolicibacterium komossense TaxID=1779 RepID=A0ABT3CMX9_9MYCO|nr:hypothetical protein [Mycolicibacterium komossense]MCV7230767.1 hypothetical protein [Mycolicibacterium komossense]
MQVAVCSYLTAGIAAIGATAIAIAPIQPTLPELHIPSAHVMSVELAATLNPIDAWVQVLQGAVNNTVGLVNQVATDPAPIVTQVVTNQVANLTLLGNTAQQTIQTLINAAQQLPAVLQSVAQQLAAGQIVDAWNTLVLYTVESALGLVPPITAVVQIAQNTVQNVANAIGVVPDAILALGLGAIAPVVSTLTAGAQTVQDVIEAIGAGDAAAALGAIVNAPAALTDAFLNGNPASFFPAGLLSPWTGSAFDSGPIAIALALRDEFANALFPVGHQPQAQQQAAPQSASIRQAAPDEESAPTVTPTRTAGPKATKSTGSSRPTARPARSAADAQAAAPGLQTASAGDTPKDTTGGISKAGQQRGAVKSGSRHEKASAGANG